MKISWETLHQLIENRLCQAGLRREHAVAATEVLVYINARGTRPCDAVRVEYYAECVSKGGINYEPEFRLEEAGSYSAILRADNAVGQVAAKMGMEHAVKTAQQKSVAVIGISRMGRSGAAPYSVQQTARIGLIGISLCQSDPTAVPFGDAEIYYDTNSPAFVAPGEGDEIFTLSMATTAQAWGKALDAHLRNMSIPDTWAVDKNGAPTTDPLVVYALLSAAGPKGYSLMMMIDVLLSVLLGLPFRRRASPMYDDLYVGRSLGQLHIVINPNFFSSSELFRQRPSQTMCELNIITPVSGLNQVYYPGQDQDIKQ